MKTYKFHSKTGLSLVNEDLPALGPHDVRIRVRAVSLNYADLMVARYFDTFFSEAIVPVSDCAGEVIEIGAAVSRFSVGARVLSCFFPLWIDGPIPANHEDGVPGVLAEEVILNEQAIVAMPEYLTFEEGATLPCAGLTAWNALFEGGNLKAGDTVVVQGTGGVSLFALQLAKAAGAEVILTSSGAEKCQRALSMGASHTVDYKKIPTWGEHVWALTGNRGADLVVEVGGAGTFDQTVAALRFGGTMSLIGILAGIEGHINTLGIVRKGLHVAGIHVGSRGMFESFNRALGATRIRPVIDTIFDFDQAQQAYDRIASGAHFGKVVIRVY